MNFRISSIVFCYILTFPALSWAGSLNFSPVVQLVNQTSERLLLSYLEPCGSKFHSVLIQELETEVRIAVVVQQENTICTALPRQKTASLAHFQWPKEKKLNFISPFLGKGRLQIAATQNMKQEEGGQRSLYFQTNCVDFLGLIVQADSSERLKVGVLQFVEKKSADKTCARKLEFAAMEVLKYYPNQAITLLNQVSSKQYEKSLELHPVTFTARSAKEISVMATLDCGQEVIGAAIRENSSGTLSVGALVLRRNEKGSPCVQQAKRWELNLSGLEPAQKKRLISLPSVLALPNWKMVSPILRFATKQGYAVERGQSDLCNDRAELDFQVYGVDQSGTVALGVLTRSDRFACYDSAHATKHYQATHFVRQDSSLSLVPMTLVGLD